MHDGTAPFAGSGRGALRVATAGSVDDGKSTLIGRLLVDGGMLPDDQLAALRSEAVRQGRDDIDFSSVTDGLSEERTQGITIDVAYRYVETPRRRLILADVPGHEQYTRNMITGASTAAAVIILADARRGPTLQTWRHLCIALLLGVRDIVVVVNKMDLVDRSPAAFAAVRADVERYAAGFAATRLHFVPVSARHGDNVARRSGSMPWYDGPTLLEALDSIQDRTPSETARPLRFPVQLVSRSADPDGTPRRAILGRLSSGGVARGDAVVVLPSGRAAHVASVELLETPVQAAQTPQSVALTLDRDLDVARGDLLAHPERQPYVTSSFDAVLFWLGRRPLDPRGRYVLRHTTRTVRARIAGLDAGIDVAAAARTPPPATLEENGIAVAHIVTQAPLALDAYRDDPACGSFILMDEPTNETIAAGIVGDFPAPRR